MAFLIIENITELITCERSAASPENEPAELGLIKNASLVIENDRIVWAGCAQDLPEKYRMADSRIIPGAGKVVTPGLIDPHTHTVFAGSRENEFEDKIRGVSYLEIARKGGGIASTVAATRNASVEELAETGLGRLDRMLALGVTTVEIKSGYGLNYKTERNMLKAARILSEEHAVDVVPTFLGAHIIPPEFRSDRRAYIDLLKNEMIPAVAEEGLALFCDCFIEQEAYTAEEAVGIFEAGKQYKLQPKVHTNQFTSCGGVDAALSVGAVSVDHLENITDDEIDKLAGSGTTAVLLPGVSFFLGVDKYAPARKLIERGINVALSTDFNPGSSMTDSLLMVMSIACTQMKMTPAEVIIAVTKHAAKSLGVDGSKGSIAPGNMADITMFDVPGYRYIPYHFGSSDVQIVIKNGNIVFERMDY